LCPLDLAQSLGYPVPLTDPETEYPRALLYECSAGGLDGAGAKRGQARCTGGKMFARSRVDYPGGFSAIYSRPRILNRCN
jgi:hypothetical protein